MSSPTQDRTRSPYVVPPFKPYRKPEPIERYFWWSWHPLYAYWCKSCWGGKTEEEAHAILKKPIACGMDVYHSKLIRENDDGTLTEVADKPCERLEVWWKIWDSQGGKIRGLG